MSGKPKPVEWGIIGCGAIATHAIAPAMLWSDWSTVAAVASRNIAKAKEKADEIKASKYYGSYDELVADPDIEAVYIGLPNGLHEEWTLKCLEAGKHVLCEKSIALTSAAAKRMSDAAMEAEKHLMEAFMYRHHPQWDTVKSLINNHRIGDVRVVRAGLSGMLENTEDHRWSSEIGGGALYDVTCYGANLARMIFGREPASVVAMADTQTSEKVDRTSSAILDFGYGRTASITGSLALYNHQFCEIEGTSGRITLQHPFIPGWEQTRVVVEDGMDRESIAVSGANHYLHMVDHFAMCVRDAHRPLDPGENGLAQMLVNEAIEQSWIAGQVVEIQDPDEASNPYY